MSSSGIVARGVAAAALLALAVACEHGPRRRDRVPEDAAIPLAAASSASAPASSVSAARSATPPAATARSATSSPSWLGMVVDPAVRFERTLRLLSRKDRGFAAELRVPVGWRAVNLENGMYDETLAYMAIAPDKTALVILFCFEPGVWHETLVNREAERWLRVSGGVEVEGWDAPAPIEIGDERTRATRVAGRGVLAGGPAELWQVRRRLPSAETGKYAMVAVGAVAARALPARKAEMVACLATFGPTPAEP